MTRRQQTRAFELRSALSLAKLYQSSGRAADARAVLAPALEGFSPTPEFAEIEQAQALLARLVATDEVKNAAAVRQRRLKLQTSYGHAIAMFRGFSSDETKAAFAKAQQMLVGIDDPPRTISHLLRTLAPDRLARRLGVGARPRGRLCERCFGFI